MDMDNKQKESIDTVIEPEVVIVEHERPRATQPIKVVSVDRLYHDSLRTKYLQFEIDGYAYQVKTILRKMRRVVKLLGRIAPTENNMVKIFQLPEDYHNDPLGIPGNCFYIGNGSYKVNGRSNRNRTVKCIGMPVFDGHNLPDTEVDGNA